MPLQRARRSGMATLGPKSPPIASSEIVTTRYPVLLFAFGCGREIAVKIPVFEPRTTAIADFQTDLPTGRSAVHISQCTRDAPEPSICVSCVGEINSAVRTIRGSRHIEKKANLARRPRSFRFFPVLQDGERRRLAVIRLRGLDMIGELHARFARIRIDRQRHRLADASPASIVSPLNCSGISRFGIEHHFATVVETRRARRDPSGT